MSVARKPPTPEEEAALVRAACSGTSTARAAAHAALFAALRHDVFAVCLHLTGSRALAEDATQDTFISAFRALPAFRGDSRLSTWLYRIAVRSSLRHRARERANRTEPLLESVPSGANAAADHEQRDLVEQALQTLPLEQRTVITLFGVDGLSHREIAEIVGVPEGTVWSRLHKAKKALAAALETATNTNGS